MILKKLVFLLITSLVVIGSAGCASKETNGSKGGSNNKTVVFATAPDGGAFSAKDNGKLTGFDVEIVEALAKKEHLKVEWKEMKFSGIIPALQSKQIDGAAAAITIRDDRKAVTDFTDPYFKSGLVLVVKKDSPIKGLQDLKGKTIVAKQGTSGLEKANQLAKEYGAKVKILEDEPTLYMDVETGGSDALINDFPFVLEKINSGTAGNLKIIGDKLTGEDYGIAITKGNDELLKGFNKSLKEMKKDGEYQTIYDKYFGKK
ncbi:ABC transporter substrate-binding protein [Bacillus sp. MUM 116]|uniref:transporter substrate-binding domain-containing protein n=1 Tax=Bacillus sp. MUM 116 TaxID=1678002 RepID=UPI0008F5D85B|nr:transporter substrate-binding domain-containing protein [Bacillus sp. MUM 116]OIK10742.1 ABC transporter substrate-binding protein [Bacillus sp. MUM 116]